jgi:hypothetical protein
MAPVAPYTAIFMGFSFDGGSPRRYPLDTEYFNVL